MMTKSTVIAAIVFSLAIGAGAPLAQNPPPAPAGTTDKQAISKACSDQANAKGLHGAQEVQSEVQAPRRQDVTKLDKWDR